MGKEYTKRRWQRQSPVLPPDRHALVSCAACLSSRLVSVLRVGVVCSCRCVWCAGISKDMAKNREVVDQFLPALKGDYLAVDKYTYREGKHAG